MTLIVKIAETPKDVKHFGRHCSLLHIYLVPIEYEKFINLSLFQECGLVVGKLGKMVWIGRKKNLEKFMEQLGVSSSE